MEKELSPLQKKFREFFEELLKKFGVKSPAELDEEKKSEFFNTIAKWWINGVGPKKDPEDIKIGENLNESPVGLPGRTGKRDALEYIAKNPEKVKELKKIIKEIGGKTVFLHLINIIMDKNFDDKDFKVLKDDFEELRLKKIEKVLQGKFL